MHRRDLPYKKIICSKPECFIPLIADFLRLAAGLKDVPRQGWIDKLGHRDPESVAEHVYLMAVMGMVFSDLNGANPEKTLKMILLHDLAESLVGDMTPEMQNRESKARLENDAMVQILGQLPEPLCREYQTIWHEFQQNATPEAGLVHQLDKLEMALQAQRYARDGYSAEQLAPFFESAEAEINEKNIKEILGHILQDEQGNRRAGQGTEPGHRHSV